jgi:hypothetical protein
MGKLKEEKFMKWMSCVVCEVGKILGDSGTPGGKF